MEIRRWHCYIAINCAVIIPCLVGKPVSLNDIIAAENQRKETLEVETTPQPEIRQPGEESVLGRRSSKAASTRTPWLNTKKLKTKLIPLDKKRSLLKYRKSFEIKSPLNKLLKKRQNQSNKREINENGNINQKYIPLLTNLRMLLNNLVTTDEDEPIEVNTKRNKQKRKSTDTSGMVCTCTRKSKVQPKTANFKSPKKTIISTTTFTTEVSSVTEVTTEATDTTPVVNISSIRRNKDIPALFPGDTFSSRRNTNGDSERSSSSLHGSFKRNISGDNGNSQYNSRIRTNEPYTKSNEENTHCDSRDDAGCRDFRRGNGSDTQGTTSNPSATEVIKLPKNKTASIFGYTNEFEKQDKHEARRNETESRGFLPEHDRGLRRIVSENKIGLHTESLQSKEDYEESYDSVAYNHTSDQRIIDRSGSSATEAEDVNEELDTVVSINDLSNLTLALQSAPKGKVPIVTIFGGYSVARDINGQNKLSEKSIHIHA